MGANYSDSRYGVERILTFASVTASNTGAVVKIMAPVNMYITEFGLMISTLLTGNITIMYLSSNSSTSFGSITINGSAGTTTVGTLLTSSALTTVVSASTPLIVFLASAATSGAVTPYVKYHSTFV